MAVISEVIFVVKTTYSLGLLQLLGQLLHSLRLFLSHLVDLGLMGSVLLLHGPLQNGHLLLSLGSERWIIEMK